MHPATCEALKCSVPGPERPSSRVSPVCKPVAGPSRGVAEHGAMRGMQSGATQRVTPHQRWWSASCRARRISQNRRATPPRAVVSRPPERQDLTDASTAAPPPQPSTRSVPQPFGAVASFVDDRLRADPRFLSKVGIEVGVDSACTIAAELAARGAAAFGAPWFECCVSFHLS